LSSSHSGSGTSTGPGGGETESKEDPVKGGCHDHLGIVAD
jgi:hypothetical protein